MTTDQLAVGIHHTTHKFSSPLLQAWEWPCIEIVGGGPGPRLAIYAGMHVNEVSSIEAAIRLASAFNPDTLRGRVSILPVLNLPALAARNVLVNPIDGKNINFCFPGNPNGSFSEVLAESILNEWAADAICLVDLHGGDFGEEVSRFNLYQRTGDDEFDQKALELAKLFDADFISALGPEYLQRPGRSISYRAQQRRFAAFAEAGVGGIVDEASVRYHFDGVLRIASHFGMVPAGDVPPLTPNTPTVLADYTRVSTSRSGWCRILVKSGEKVHADQVVAQVVNFYGELLEEIRTPHTGWVLWTQTAPVVDESNDILGLGY